MPVRAASLPFLPTISSHKVGPEEPYASNRLSSTDVGSCRPLVPHVVSSRSASQGSEQRLMLLRCLIISRLELGVGMKQIRGGAQRDHFVHRCSLCESHAPVSESQRLEQAKTPKTAHETRQLKPRLRQCFTLAIPLPIVPFHAVLQSIQCLCALFILSLTFRYRIAINSVFKGVQIVRSQSGCGRTAPMSLLSTLDETQEIVVRPDRVEVYARDLLIVYGYPRRFIGVVRRQEEYGECENSSWKVLRLNFDVCSQRNDPRLDTARPEIVAKVVNFVHS